MRITDILKKHKRNRESRADTAVSAKDSIKSCFNTDYPPRIDIPAGNYDYIHPKVLLAYYGSNPITITLMYGSVENAQALISRLEKCFNDPSEDRRVESALEVYRYTWSRYAQGKMTPAQVKDSLQRILHYRKRELNRCIDIALEYIDERRKPMSERKPRQNPFEILVKENAEKNRAVQYNYMSDPEYGLVPSKPIFVKGYGNDRNYMARLRAKNGDYLHFNRLGSFQVDGIAGAVDKYSVKVPLRTFHTHIYICIYGTENSNITPVGFTFCY